MGVVFVCLICLLIIVIICMVDANTIICWFKNNRAPVHSIRANVLTTEVNGHKYYACFGLEDGQMKKFPIDYYAYMSLKEGEIGILTYKGTRFIRYDRGGE